MSEKRMVRDRSVSKPITGGLRSALARRIGKDVPKKLIVEYFGDTEDTPVLSYLKAAPKVLQNFRGGEHIHVSDVISKCIRKLALMRRTNMRHPQEHIPDGRGITFTIGDAIHDYVKARLTTGQPDRVWARWSCACGHTSCVGVFSNRQVTKCPRCGTAVDRHNEVPFLQQEFMLQGTPDLLLYMSEYNAFYINEIKSIAAAQWKELTRPLPDHVIQVAMYWHIMKACEQPLVDKVSILYVNKEFSFTLPYKEFMVDPQEVDLGIYYDDLRALVAAGNDGPLPMRVVCGSDTAPEAKKCPVCVSCFGCD